jgi:hypothetical protein
VKSKEWKVSNQDLLKWHGFLMIKLAALAAGGRGLNSESQNIEGWFRCAQSFFK